MNSSPRIKAAQTVLDCTRRYPLMLYLVDNASPDGSGQRLTAAAKDGTLRTAPGQTVQVLCRLENGGFGTGHNTVLSLLQSRVHFILNPDIQLTADTLSDLADWMAAHPGVVMTRWGSATTSSSGALCTTAVFILQKAFSSSPLSSSTCTLRGASSRTMRCASARQRSAAS